MQKYSDMTWVDFARAAKKLGFYEPWMVNEPLSKAALRTKKTVDGYPNTAGGYYPRIERVYSYSVQGYEVRVSTSFDDAPWQIGGDHEERVFDFQIVKR